MIWEAVRIVQAAKIGSKDVVWDWMLLGLAMGVGWWATPETLYFSLPAAIFVALSLRAHRGGAVGTRVLVVVTGAVLGALPWIVVSLRVGLSAFGAKTPSPVPYLTRLSTFFTHVLPMLLGLRIEGEGQWEIGPVVGGLLVALLLAGLVAAMITVALRVPDARVLVGSLVIFPFLYAAFPTSWFWNDGRYGIALAPIASLVGIGALWQLARPLVARGIGVAILAAAVVSTVVAVDVGYGGFSNVSGLSNWRANPNSAVTALSAKLQALGIRDVYAGYWDAYDLAFVSAGRIQVAPIVNDRDPGESNAVAGAARVGWVFVPATHVGEVAGQVGSTTGLDPVVEEEQTLASWMTANGIRFRTATVGPFLLVLPDRNTWPRALLGPGRPS